MRKNDYYSKVKSILEEAWNNVCRHVNFVMVEAYWNIWRIIVEEEQAGRERTVIVEEEQAGRERTDYGAAVIVNLSKMLTKDFSAGFSEPNI